MGPACRAWFQWWRSVVYCTLTALQRTNTENWKQIFPEKELRGHGPNFHIHVSVRDLYIPTNHLPILLQEICGPILGIYKALAETWMWKLGLRPSNPQKREYINEVFVAVCIPVAEMARSSPLSSSYHSRPYDPSGQTVRTVHHNAYHIYPLPPSPDKLGAGQETVLARSLRFGLIEE